jgi:RNA polymerase sigma-70 factor, ECF subfamily
MPCHKPESIPKKGDNVVSATSSQIVVNHQNDFEGAVLRFSPMLRRVALRRLCNVEDAEDAVQDALLSAWKHMGQFEGRSRLSTWLTRIVLNAAGMQLRRHPHNETVSLSEDRESDGAVLADELIDARPSPEASCAQEEMAEILHQAIAKLSPKVRVALQLADLGELSTREAAEVLEISISSLKSRRTRARATLSSLLDKFAGTNSEEGAPVSDRTGVVRRRRGSPEHGKALGGAGRKLGIRKPISS